MSPFFSHDGQSIGFLTTDEVKKAPVNGGASVTVARLREGMAGAWGPDDRLIIAAASSTVSITVSGAPETITSTSGRSTFPGLDILPNGKGFIYTGGAPADGTAIRAFSFETQESVDLVEGGSRARYARNGHLVFARDGAIFAAPFDQDGLRLTGEAVLIADGASEVGPNGIAWFDVSDEGTLVYASDAEANGALLVWVDRFGNPTLAFPERRLYMIPRLSPDGSQFAAQISQDGRVGLWMSDFRRGSMIRRAYNEGFDGYPVWTRDGKSIAFAGGQPSAMFWRPADGSGEVSPLLSGEHPQYPISFSHDDAILAYRVRHPESRNDIWMLSMDEGTATPFLTTPARETSAAFSPIGNWVAFESDESGRPEIYIESYPGARARWPVSVQGGTEPMWSADGRELFYRSDRRMMVVKVDTEQPGLTLGIPELLFEVSAETSRLMGASSYDVHPDGTRFLMIQDAQELTGYQLRLVLNWTRALSDELP